MVIRDTGQLAPRSGERAPEPLISYSPRALERLTFPEVAWLVEDLVPAGALTLLVGRPKAGKSLLAIDMLGSVATGARFLERPTQEGAALYFPAEDALPLVRDRIFARLGGERDAPLEVVPADGSLNQVVRIDNPDSFGRLAATVGRFKARLAVLDPFRELHHQPENEAEPMSVILRALRQLAHKTGCAVVLVHHRNKHASDPALATRGSSAIAGGADATITLDVGGDSEEPEADQLLTLRVEGRYGPRQKLCARLGGGLRWMPVAFDEGANTGAQGRVLGYLRAGGVTLTAAELAQELGLVTKTVQNALGTLTRAGSVLRSGSGRSNDPFRYRAAYDAADQTPAGQASFEPF